MMMEDAMETDDISSTSDYLGQLICILENVNLNESVAHQSIRCSIERKVFVISFFKLLNTGTWKIVYYNYIIIHSHLGDFCLPCL